MATWDMAVASIKASTQRGFDLDLVGLRASPGSRR